MERLTERTEVDFQCNDNECRLSYCDRGCGNYQLMVNKLGEYEDAEEQGLLLRLPCKVGDMLYHISSYYNVVIPVRLNDIIVSFAGIDNYPKQYNCCSFDECGDVYEDFEFDNNDFGKTVFLTKEEAEQALKQMKGV